MHRFVRYIVYFNNLWHKFEEIDSDHDRRINAQEFAVGCATVGLDLTPEEAAAEFAACDTDGGGMILFGEFCTWCAAREYRPDEDEGEGEDEDELPGGTEELGAGRRRGGVYEEEEPMDESADDDDAASEAESFSQQSAQHSQAVPAAAANAFRAKRKRA